MSENTEAAILAMTGISEAGPFLEAEAEDQDYFRRYPDSSRFPQPRLEAASHEIAP